MSNNSINGSPLYQSHSLSRSNTFTRMNVSPKCFGTSQYIHKEEHERECRRWQTKLDEAEEKFAEACVNNSDMLQIKAELNKKIVELEKNQRPLIEQNKRLSDRNRIIQQELKKVEEKLCHAQDDFLTLKDAYDRLAKENNTLKEQRAFPEKVKELDRYRNQVLEYSKCINALRQSGIEKDRRYDLLVQKFKRMKKCLTKRSDDDDRHSSYGSEGSTESSINLDTITEDIDEALEIDHTSFCYDHEVALKLNALAFGEEQILKEQLEVANTTINELQATLTSRDNMSKVQEEYLSTIEKQNIKLQEIQNTCNSLKIKLANSEEHNDLLEFQILELREMSKDAEISTEDKGIETDTYLSDNDAENIFEDIKAFVNMDASTIQKAKNVLKDLRRLACLKVTERDAVKKILQHIENLENKLSFAETELNMATCEIRRLESVKNDEINELKNQLAEAEARTSKKKKELQTELEMAKKECSKATKNYLEKEKENNNMATFVQNLQASLQKNETLTMDEKKRVAELERKLTEIEAKYSQDINSAKQKEDEKLQTLNSITLELNAIKKSYSDAVQEKEKLNEKIIQLQTVTADKEKQFEAKINELNSNLKNIKEKYETENNALVQEIEKTRTELKESSTSLKTTHDVYDLEQKKAAAALKEAAIAKEKYEKEKQNQIAELEKVQKESERALAEARTEIDALKAQIRPIGTQLERRFEETKYRLQESNKMNEKYEELLKVANSRITELQSSKEDIYLQEIQQLKIYNHELEEQFASQMEIIAALKKKFLLLNNNTDTTENENWTKLTAQPKNSIEDEQYHSEGSSSVGSINSISRNKV